MRPRPGAHPGVLARRHLGTVSPGQPCAGSVAARGLLHGRYRGPLPRHGQQAPGKRFLHARIGRSPRGDKYVNADRSVELPPPPDRGTSRHLKAHRPSPMHFDTPRCTSMYLDAPEAPRMALRIAGSQGGHGPSHPCRPVQHSRMFISMNTLRLSGRWAGTLRARRPLPPHCDDGADRHDMHGNTNRQPMLGTRHSALGTRCPTPDARSGKSGAVQWRPRGRGNRASGLAHRTSANAFSNRRSCSTGRPSGCPRRRRRCRSPSGTAGRRRHAGRCK